MRVVAETGVVLEVLDHPGAAGPEAPVLLMLHGFGGSALDFDDHLDGLARTHRVVRYFHRGHGPSSRPSEREAYSLDRLAADALAVADAVGAERFELFGWSLGGMVARRVLLTAPERVQRVVLQDTTPGPVPGFEPHLVDLAIETATRDGMAALKALLDAAQTLVTPAYERLVATRAGYREYVEGRFWTMSPEAWSSLAHAIAHQDDDTDALRAVDVPALVIVGELDSSFIPGCQAIASALPRAELVEIPDAGHAPQFENPEAWIKAMTAFLEQP